MDDHNKILIEELEKRLLWYREEASGKEFDPEAVDAICTMLQKLSPEQEPHRTKEEAFENIMRQIRLEEAGGDSGRKRDESRMGSIAGESAGGAEKEESGRESVGDAEKEESGRESSGGADESEFARKRAEKAGGGKVRRFLLRKSGMRAAVIIIAVAGIFFSLDRVTYARENKSLFTMILERVGWLEIEKEEDVESTAIGFGEREEEFFESWTDLDSKVKEKIIVPMYIPEGYSLYGIRCWEHSNREEVRSNYYDQGNGHLWFEITLWKDNVDHYRETIMDETIYTLLSEYSDENTLYYKYEDEYICILFRENSFYRISGNITLDEMIKIREGLGDTRPK